MVRIWAIIRNDQLQYSSDKFSLQKIRLETIFGEILREARALRTLTPQFYFKYRHFFFLTQNSCQNGLIVSGHVCNDQKIVYSLNDSASG